MTRKEHPVRRVVLSGCSGGGKSALVAAMARRGWTVCEEPGRRVVRTESAQGGAGVPWRDAERFARLCIELCLDDLAQPAQGVVLHDRSLVDAVSALRRMGRLRDGDVDLLATRRYWNTVLLAPPWPELFLADAERRHGFEEAVAEYDDLCLAYPAAGYTVMEVPRMSVAERADWVEALMTGETEVAR